MENSVSIGSLRHIAITADGNGRWAVSRGLPRTAGHKASQSAFRSVLTSCSELGLPFLSLHVFSSENWKRPPAEVDFLVRLFSDVLLGSAEVFKQLDVQFRLLGRPDRLPADLLRVIKTVEANTANNLGTTLLFGLNYGGQGEIVDVVRTVAEEVYGGRLDPASIDLSTVQSALYIPNVPPVDLYIRTGGECRISNFFLWQLAYSELVFMDTLWPDFRGADLISAINTFKSRKRSYGEV